jgi:gluconolactonase
LSRPNGIALSPDNRHLYVSNSDRSNLRWNIYDINEDGTISNGRLFYDGSHLLANSTVGNADGFKVDSQGNIIASAPGGVVVISAVGELLGMFKIDRAVSNVAFGKDGMLYFTASDVVLRVQTKMVPPINRYNYY